MLCGTSDKKDSKKSKKNKTVEIKVYVDLELNELKLGKDNRTKLIKALLGATMHTKQYDISQFVLKKYILDLTSFDLIPMVALL